MSRNYSSNVNLHLMWHSKHITEIQTAIARRNPVNGVDIAGVRDEGQSRLGQPGMNAGPTTG